jgi:hypothetical protein
MEHHPNRIRTRPRRRRRILGPANATDFDSRPMHDDMLGGRLSHCNFEYAFSIHRMHDTPAWLASEKIFRKRWISVTLLAPTIMY